MCIRKHLVKVKENLTTFKNTENLLDHTYEKSRGKNLFVVFVWDKLNIALQ